MLAIPPALTVIISGVWNVVDEKRTPLLAFEDTFTRADADTLGSPWTHLDGQSLGSKFGVRSGEARFLGPLDSALESQTTVDRHGRCDLMRCRAIDMSAGTHAQHWHGAEA